MCDPQPHDQQSNKQIAIEHKLRSNKLRLNELRSNKPRPTTKLSTIKQPSCDRTRALTSNNWDQTRCDQKQIHPQPNIQQWNKQTAIKQIDIHNQTQIHNQAATKHASRPHSATRNSGAAISSLRVIVFTFSAALFMTISLPMNGARHSYAASSGGAWPLQINENRFKRQGHQPDLRLIKFAINQNWEPNKLRSNKLRSATKQTEIKQAEIKQSAIKQTAIRNQTNLD